jgi:hypothetical protein
MPGRAGKSTERRCLFETNLGYREVRATPQSVRAGPTVVEVFEMRIGASLTLFTVGAILGLAVHVDTSVINVNLIGLILMLVAIVGFALSPAARSIQRRTTVTVPGDDAGRTAGQETVEEPDGQPVAHPKWASRTVAVASRPDDADRRAGQRGSRSWPSAG